MTTETETKLTEQSEDKKEVAKEEVKRQEEDAKNAEEKLDDKAEKPDKEKKEEEKAKDDKAQKKEAAPPKPTVHKVDFDKDVIYLYQFTRTPVLPSLSPYCLKVETWLRLAGIKYENVDHRMKYKSKKGQLPFVEINGEEIADSAIIIREIGQRFNTDLDAGLSSEQRNVAHANISMIENHFAWVVKFWRTKNPATMLSGYKMDLQHITDKKWPKPVLEFIFKIKFRRAAKKVRAHGIGVHKPEEIEEFGHNDLKVLSDLLGDKKFFFGDQPTTLDVVAFANLSQVVFLDKDVSYSLRDWMAAECSNLSAFCERMKERAFPDWDDMCANLDLNSHLPKPEPPKEEKPEATEEKKEEEAGHKEKEDKKDEKEKDDSEKESEKAQKEDEKEKDNKKADEK